MVHIIADTTACLPVDVAERYHIPVIPQILVLGSNSFKEGSEIDHATFMKWLRTSPEMPKTAAPPPELFTEEFRRMVSTGEPILCIHPSCEVSGTVRSATIAAQDFPDADIRVIDTRTIGSPLMTMVTLAARWAEAGEDADTIETRLRQDFIPNCRIYFLVATLEYLAKGGRIGAAAALLGSVLQIKPILVMNDGRVDQFERERTHRRALARLKEMAVHDIPAQLAEHVTVMHAAVPDQAAALAEFLRQHFNLTRVTVVDIPPAIVTHAGPGVLCIGFFLDHNRPLTR
jgi:DegV family protein with EDD domain